MSTEISQTLDRLETTKERIRRNLVAQGVEVPSEAKLEEMASLILSVAGEPGLVWKGSWHKDTTYSLGDAVYYEGSSYIFIEGKSAPSGIEPDTDDTVWQLLASQGKQGDKGDSGVIYIEGNSTTAGTWIGTHADIDSYFDGLTVAYKTNVAGASATTLNINGLGAVPVNRNASTAVSTSYPVGSVVILTYSAGAWLTADYDANTKNTAGTSNKADAKMYLVGATSQTSSGTTTYTNTNAYIGTDNCLYSGGKKVVDVGSAIAVTGIDADGVSHSWTMYGVAK